MYIPKVSVVMPVYNGEAYVESAANSILHQTFTDFELIIINDGSTDGTATLLTKIATDERVKILHNEINAGLTYTRNKGLANSRGEYIAMLDSDDIALPERLEKQLAFLKENPGVALVGSYINLIESDGRYIRTQCYPTPPAYIPSLLLFQNNFAQSAVMVRREALPAELYRKDFPLAEDYDLWVCMAATHKVANIQKALVKYRVHSSSISHVKAKAHRESIKKIVYNQLQHIGVTANEQELELHVQIGLLEIPKQRQALEAAEQWLIKLKQANEQTDYYAIPAFNTIVGQKWYEICHTSGLGKWAYGKMLSSPLFSLKCASYILQMKLMCKVLPKL